MAEAELLELKDIRKSYGSHEVLKGISLTVHSGEFLTFLGPSGCGKTTTLRLIGGFEQPDTGSVFLEGKDVSRVPPHKRDVHTVFQHYALFPHLDLFENVAFGLRLKGTQRDQLQSEVAEVLELVKLSGLERRRIHEISGGQQQRVALARALVGRPKLLLLDEPLGALDLKLRRQMQIELKAIQKKTGLTFIYVTHDQEEALTLSDRIAVFSAGEIVQLGEPRAIYEAPRSSFVADFIGSANILGAVVRDLQESVISLGLDGGGVARLPRPRGPRLAQGQKLEVAVRPERIEVSFSEPLAAVPGSVCLKGRLDQIIYLGSSSQVQATLVHSGQSLTAVTLDRLDPHFRNGSGHDRPVWLILQSSDLVVLA